MNGVHDMGGMHGFGPVIREANEPVFHEPWEGRMWGILTQVRATHPAVVGEYRDIIEHIEPARYLASGYYERFLEVLKERALRAGLVTPDELAAREEIFRANGATKVSERRDPVLAANARARLGIQPHPVSEGAPPRFAVGEPVTVRNLHWSGHNRLPRYIRAKRGVVERINGLYFIEDARAEDLGPNPQSVYTVAFAGREVWGEECEPNTSIHIELWEGYLEPTAARQE